MLIVFSNMKKKTYDVLIRRDNILKKVKNIKRLINLVENRNN